MKNTTMLKPQKTRSVSSPIIKSMLKVGFLAGAAGIVVVAPNAMQALSVFINNHDKGNKRSSRFKEYANKSGYFKVSYIGQDRYAITLSKKGNLAAEDVLFGDYQIEIPKKWDGMWHILMFDISERERTLRDTLRYKISDVGMEMLQGSVYVFPHPIEDFVSKLHQRYPESTKHVLCVTAKSIDGEAQLIEKFRLKKLI